MTQHIPNKGEHQIRCHGWYSNNKRGMQDGKEEQGKERNSAVTPGQDTLYRRNRRLTWTALIEAVYEADPLKCPECGGEMKIVAFIVWVQSLFQYVSPR